jgi:hypothetical protein
MTSFGKLWGRHAGVDSPASGNGPTITAGWHTLVRVWDGREVRQHVDGLRTDTTPVTASGSWTIHRWGQFAGSQRLDEACVPFFGAFGSPWDDAMAARWSANPLALLWPEMDATFVTSGGGPPLLQRGGQWSSSPRAKPSRPSPGSRHPRRPRRGPRHPQDHRTPRRRHVRHPADQGGACRRTNALSLSCMAKPSLLLAFSTGAYSVGDRPGRSVNSS